MTAANPAAQRLADLAVVHGVSIRQREGEIEFSEVFDLTREYEEAIRALEAERDALKATLEDFGRARDSEIAKRDALWTARAEKAEARVAEFEDDERARDARPETLFGQFAELQDCLTRVKQLITDIESGLARKEAPR